MDTEGGASAEKPESQKRDTNMDDQGCDENID
jgi:hypothetical protein